MKNNKCLFLEAYFTYIKVQSATCPLLMKFNKQYQSLENIYLIWEPYSLLI